jgi:hypothetical protein
VPAVKTLSSPEIYRRSPCKISHLRKCFSKYERVVVHIVIHVVLRLIPDADLGFECRAASIQIIVDQGRLAVGFSFVAKAVFGLRPGSLERLHVAPFAVYPKCGSNMTLVCIFMGIDFGHGGIGGLGRRRWLFDAIAIGWVDILFCGQGDNQFFSGPVLVVPGSRPGESATPGL